MPQYRLFIGNPGTGKSTLANCIAECILFKSGISIGFGKTHRLDRKEYNGITYLDTPGLADINMRQDAARSITEALKQDGYYQIFFVVTLSAGRVRPEDLTPLWLVLLNAPSIKSFSIIINKVSPREYDTLQKNSKNSRLFRPLELMGESLKYMIFLSKYNQLLDDAEDTISSYPELVKFAQDTPWEYVDPSLVNYIPGDDESFKKKLDSLTDHTNNFSDNPLPIIVSFVCLFIPYYFSTEASIKVCIKV